MCPLMSLGERQEGDAPPHFLCRGGQSMILAHILCVLDIFSHRRGKFSLSMTLISDLINYEVFDAFSPPTFAHIVTSLPLLKKLCTLNSSQYQKTLLFKQYVFYMMSMQIQVYLCIFLCLRLYVVLRLKLANDLRIQELRNNIFFSEPFDFLALVYF